MFICDDCLKKYKNDKSLFRSIGNCEICGEHHDCNDIRSSQLVSIKEELLKRLRVTTIGNYDTNQYFFSTDHCQNHGLVGAWVPCTYTLPMVVAKRPSLPDGVVRTVEDIKIIFYNNAKEIANPDSLYQPDNCPAPQGEPGFGAGYASAEDMR